MENFYGPSAQIYMEQHLHVSRTQRKTNKHTDAGQHKCLEKSFVSEWAESYERKKNYEQLNKAKYWLWAALG